MTSLLPPVKHHILNTKELLEYLKPYLDTHYNKVIMHIPHASLKIPKWGKKDLLIDEYKNIDADNTRMADLFLPMLFKSWPYKKIIAKYSRLFVDVEKYWDKEEEPLAMFGLTAVYSKYHKENPKFMKRAKRYYDKYHHKLAKACKCKNNEKCLILDIHSFSDYQASEICYEERKFADVCIGFNDFNKDEELINKLELYFKSKNISYDFNEPYNGTMVPNNINTRNINSVMLEINKRLYL